MRVTAPNAAPSPDRAGYVRLTARVVYDDARAAAEGTGSRSPTRMLVWGFDVPPSDAPTFGRLRDSLRCVANEMGKTLIDIATRGPRWRHV